MKLYSNIIGEGSPLLILHGFLGMGDNWKTLGKQFAEIGFEVHLIDQRNHGRSPHSDDFSYSLMVEDLSKYIAQHKLEKASIIGHSMGGKVAMHFATTHQEKVKDLIVVDIAPKYYEPHHQQILDGLTFLNEQDLSARSDADEMLQNYIEDFGVRQFLLKNLYWKEKGKLALRMNLEALKNNIDCVGQALDEGKLYEEKTLFIKGTRSNYITEDDKDLIRNHFPKAQIIGIKDAGHWVHAEKPEEFFKAAAAFLQS
ncbi:MAG: alpha/beta fold hydrolase [Bacteroidota bacterium]